MNWIGEEGRGGLPSRVIQQECQYFAGLDLGKARDHSALVVIERSDTMYADQDPVTREWRKEVVYAVRAAERLPLGTSYMSVAVKVREWLVRSPLCGKATLVVDETGVGAPVIEMLKQEVVWRELVPVTITGGHVASRAGRSWHVPRRELLSGLQVAFEEKRLRMPAHGIGSQALYGELQVMKWSGTGTRDDMALALSLAWWKASRPTYSFYGPGRIV